ncbi:MAG: hypothetical protein AAFX53_09270 [Bacteroidota bacterium]
MSLKRLQGTLGQRAKRHAPHSNAILLGGREIALNMHADDIALNVFHKHPLRFADSDMRIVIL